MSKLNWFRAISVSVAFALVGGLEPDWFKWGFLGFSLILIVLRMEELHAAKSAEEAKGKNDVTSNKALS